ncbi:PIN domain-containing protein [Acidithiobacillus sp. VAN18-1]|uniref:PIN domain-containing protein n=2 Tax=Igneacidithiobacillus copahuensis TaxID=2724909 RepID=A0AAE3CKM4_9PROT|nr:PIN domain-containing protein [Igneacidithiobacillus copahuensis]MBU2796656.1 PIN domain-containing protein [Acidithiobacillus sp. VAN18-2]
MASDRAFFDTNILLYLFSGDPAKADIAESMVTMGGVISVQVLNEFTSVARRKMDMTFLEIKTVLAPIQKLCRTIPVTVDTHADAMRIAERYGLNFRDALIIASALESCCEILYTEDLQHGQVLEENLRVANPFLQKETSK